MIKFENFEFIFAIKGPILAKRGVVDKLINSKIGGLFFICTFGITVFWGVVHLDPKIATFRICS